MAATLWNDLYRGLAYASSELGEVLSVSADSLSVSTVKAVNGAVVLPALTTPAAAKTHVIVVHPEIGKLQTKG